MDWSLSKLKGESTVSQVRNLTIKCHTSLRPNIDTCINFFVCLILQFSVRQSKLDPCTTFSSKSSHTLAVHIQETLLNNFPVIITCILSHLTDQRPSPPSSCMHQDLGFRPHRVAGMDEIMRSQSLNHGCCCLLKRDIGWNFDELLHRNNTVFCIATCNFKEFQRYRI